MSEFKMRLTDAFKDLRKQGFFARQNFWCCQSCAWAAAPDDKPVVFFHQQDASALREAEAARGTRRFKAEEVGVYLAFGPDAAAGQKIVDSLRRHGVDYTWDGTEDQRIWACEKIELTADQKYAEALTHFIGGLQ